MFVLYDITMCPQDNSKKTTVEAANVGDLPFGINNRGRTGFMEKLA